jgi:hypothetical protein
MEHLSSKRCGSTPQGDGGSDTGERVSPVNEHSDHDLRSLDGGPVDPTAAAEETSRSGRLSQVAQDERGVAQSTLRRVNREMRRNASVSPGQRDEEAEGM